MNSEHNAMIKIQLAEQWITPVSVVVSLYSIQLTEELSKRKQRDNMEDINDPWEVPSCILSVLSILAWGLCGPFWGEGTHA